MDLFLKIMGVILLASIAFCCMFCCVSCYFGFLKLENKVIEAESAREGTTNLIRKLEKSWSLTEEFTNRHRDLLAKQASTLALMTNSGLEQSNINEELNKYISSIAGRVARLEGFINLPKVDNVSVVTQALIKVPPAKRQHLTNSEEGALILEDELVVGTETGDGGRGPTHE